MSTVGANEEVVRKYVQNQESEDKISDHFGNWGLWVIMIPAIIAFAYGLFYFERLVKESGNYL